MFLILDIEAAEEASPLSEAQAALAETMRHPVRIRSRPCEPPVLLDLGGVPAFARIPRMAILRVQDEAAFGPAQPWEAGCSVHNPDDYISEVEATARLDALWSHAVSSRPGAVDQIG